MTKRKIAIELLKATLGDCPSDLADKMVENAIRLLETEPDYKFTRKQIVTVLKQCCDWKDVEPIALMITQKNVQGKNR